MKALLTTVLLVSASPLATMGSPVDLADPRIDTVHPRIDFFASASVPYGMVALHPDTHQGSQLWDSGYRWGDARVQFFTHSHMVQTPGISTMPVVGPCTGAPGVAAHSSRFSHEQETIRPGYHKVALLDSGITEELTATCRVGLHRTTFPAAEEAQILFYLTAQIADVKMLVAEVERLSPTRIAGRVVQAPTTRRKKTTEIFFVAEFEKPFAEAAGWKGPEPVALVDGQLNGASGVRVVYRDLQAGERIQYKVAISYVSIEGAIRNLERELPGWDFDEVKEAATRQWSDYLGRIEVTGGTREQQVKFYTDLMHTAIGRRVYSDVDGAYVDRGGKEPVVRQIPLDAAGRPQWNAIDMDCLWGTQWNLNILWTLAYPDYGNWVAQTLLQYYRSNGILGRGQWGGHENFTMVGDSSTPLLAALASNGRARFDLEEAYAAGRKNAFPGGVRDHAGYECTEPGRSGGMDWYVTLGFVPAEVATRGSGWHRGGSGMTLEYAYQDWCLAQLARQLHKTDDVALFTKRSENWRNVFDASVGWARPRRESGEWVTPFSPVDRNRSDEQRGFVESSAATCSFYVPQNLPGLFEAMGGEAAVRENLEMCFTEARKHRFICPGPNQFGYVDYSNQPGCQMAHLFSYAGAPWKSQYWVRQVKEMAFGGTTPQAGYNGDEDEGQMGALGALMGIGLFSMQGCVGEEPQLEITSPLFDRVVLHVPDGAEWKQQRTFEIRVRRSDPARDLYIQSARLNGREWTDFRFPVRDLLQGGDLELQLGPEPNQRWGISTRDSSESTRGPS